MENNIKNTNLIPPSPQINVETLRPFTRFCVTIGALPTSYMLSLTYEEQLLWFCKFLQDTVIPALNNNGEAVAELQALYVELKNYVDNYFKNLDVQEEINNKLDEMAESGELEEIITQYLQIAGLLIYDNVSLLKSATNLINGSIAKTLGFYNINDKGGAFYKIRTITNEDTVNEMTLIALNNPSLVAELIKENTMNPCQFGAKADGTTDDTLSINNCINFADNILFKTATYLINPVYSIANPNVTSINVKSNKNIDFNNSTIIMNETTEDLYYMIRCYQENNIVLKNGILIGYNTTPSTDGMCFGMGIAVMDCSNVLIDNFRISNMRGDGIYIREYSNQEKTKNVVVQNCYLKNNVRNQIAFTGGENITIQNCNIIYDLENQTYSSNNTGIDIEADHDYARFKNFYINNIKIKGESNGGITVSPVYDTCPVSGIIENCYIENCGRSIYGARGGKSGDNLIFNNIIIVNPSIAPIRFSNHSPSNYNLIFRNITLESWINSQEGDTNYMFFISGETDIGVGNVFIENPVCKSNVDGLVCMNNGITNVSIKDPIFKNTNVSNRWGILQGRNTNSIINLSDSYNQIIEVITDDINTSYNFLPHICKTQNTIKDVTVNINSELVPESEELIFINTTLNNFFVGLSGAGTIKIPGGTTKGMLKAKKVGSSFVWWGSSGIDFAN